MFSGRAPEGWINLVPVGSLPLLARRLFGVPLLADPSAIQALVLVVGPRLREGLAVAPIELPHLGTIRPEVRSAAAWRAHENLRPGHRDRAEAWARSRASERTAVPTNSSAPAYRVEGQAHGPAARDVVAVVPIHGELVAREVRAEGSSGELIGYDRIVAQVRAAVEDPAVCGVVLDIDSPGGESAGAFEAAAAIRELGQRGKRIVAVANPGAYSGGYLLASAAERVLVPESGGVGSVGVYCVHVDQSALDAKEGIRVTFISAGTGKVDGHPHAPLEEGARAFMQGRADKLYAMFVHAIANARGLAPERIREIGARTFLGGDAVALGLADAIGGLDAAIELARAPAPFPATSRDAQGSRAAVTTPAIRRASCRAR